MQVILSLSVVDALFGSLEPTLAAYIEDALGPAAEDYDVVGLEYDLRSVIDAALPRASRLRARRSWSTTWPT